MSDAPRVPWWYSGDEVPAAEVPGPADEGAYAGEAGDDAAPAAGSSGWVPGLDWLGLLSGAQRIVDWAADAVLAPHAEHDDPRAHPQCLVCRASLVLGDVGRGAAADASGHGAGPDGPEESGVRWLPIRE